MSNLYQLWNKQQKDKHAFERLRKQAEANAVRWRYWETPNWHWDPEHTVKYLVFPAPGKKGSAKYEYGYDSVDRVVVMRRRDFHTSRFDCEFLFYNGNKMTGSKYIADKLYCVFEATLEEGRIVSLEQSGLCTDLKTIEWKDGKVHKVNTDDQEPLGAIVTQRTYDKKGKLIAEVDLSEVEEEEPLPKGVTLKSLDKELRGRLIQAVVKTVTKIKLKKPVYCLALNYDCEGNPIMPPMLGIGLDSERQARLKKGGKDAKLDIWEAEQMSLFAKEKTDEVIFDDKKLQKACDYYNRLLEKKGDNTPAHKLLNEIASELGRMDWKGKMNTTDDFIAYAVDTDLADLHKNLKHSVPADRLKKLKAAKML
jgi:hypothetical protein